MTTHQPARSEARHPWCAWHSRRRRWWWRLRWLRRQHTRPHHIARHATRNRGVCFSSGSGCCCVPRLSREHAGGGCSDATLGKCRAAVVCSGGRSDCSSSCCACRCAWPASSPTPHGRQENLLLCNMLDPREGGHLQDQTTAQAQGLPTQHCSGAPPALRPRELGQHGRQGRNNIVDTAPGV